jgi:hypothetical protein
MNRESVTHSGRLPMTRLIYVQSKLSKETQNFNKIGKAQRRKLSAGKATACGGACTTRAGTRNVSINPETPKASDHHQNHHSRRKNPVCSPHERSKPKSTQAREGHAPITERPHNRGERLEHQRLTTNTANRRVSTRRRRKLVDLASKNLTVINTTAISAIDTPWVTSPHRHLHHRTLMPLQTKNRKLNHPPDSHRDD